MKDKKIVGIIAAAIGGMLLLLAAVFLLDFFAPGGSGHTHKFGEFVSSDDEKHIFACRCGNQQETAHEYGEGEIQTEPTCGENGSIIYSCQHCTHVKFQNIEKTNEHRYSDGKCRNCDDIMLTDEEYFEFTLLEDGTYSVAQAKDKVSSYIKNIRIPESYKGKLVTAISELGFEKNARIESVYIPDSVKEIGYSAFYECTNLAYIKISENVKSIPRFAFGGCRDLRYIIIPNTLESIEAYAFSNCLVLQNIDLPAELNFIGHSAFANCRRLETVSMGATKVSVIEESAFYACTGIKAVVLPETLTFIGTKAFAECNVLVSVNIPTALEYLGDSAFENCKKLKSKIVLPDTLSYLGERAFASCAITEVTLPSNIVILRENVFRNCTALSIPVLPETLVEIHYGAFYKCDEMPEYLPTSLKTIGNYAFYDVKNAGEVKYDGTTAGFMNIELGISVFAGTDTVIVCTDGEVEAGANSESEGE